MKRTAQAEVFNLKVEFSREDDGRWIADIPALPGVTVYERTRRQALASAEALCGVLPSGYETKRQQWIAAEHAA